MKLRPILALALCIPVAACAGGSPVPAPSGAASPSAPLATASPAAGAIELRPTPPDLGCDSIGWEGEPYHTLTFHIDPAAADPVWVTADTGAVLRTYWPAGFQGSGTERVIRDPAGGAVAADGEVVQLPVGANPRLLGYPLCVTTAEVYVMLPEPGG
jgi:hypothetical protein